MAKEYKKGLVIFRRDLRLADNEAFAQALLRCKMVIPCFIFDPRQVGDKNPYKSENAIQFMLNSLKDLQKQLKQIGGKLYLFYGYSEKVIKNLIKQEDIEVVFCNRDYTPFSKKRDKAIAALCSEHDVEFIHTNGVLLNEPEDIMTNEGTSYKVFTPYYKKARKIKIQKPKKIPKTKDSLYTKNIKSAESEKIFSKILKKENKDLLIKGGRQEALTILKSLKEFEDYKKERDYPSIATTHLSAHLKFGTVSSQEVFHAIIKKLGPKHGLIQQLYWRDFWTYIAFHAPSVFGQAFKEKYRKLNWSTSKKNFEAWCEGKTGFPIVDAGMRQLNTIGFMHNRVRMIVASFLTKDLRIDWRWGEKYFAQQLVDYDPCVNNGNWQWSASIGCDAQPYFRIFNPWTQQKKFDPECKYIKRWVPELKKVDNKTIFAWDKKYSKDIDYPKPMIDHSVESKETKQWFKHV